MKQKKWVKILSLSAVALALSACGSMNNIDADGNFVNKDIKWGKIENSTFKTSGKQHGMWISGADVQKIKDVKTKAQLYKLLDRPHYHEGFVNVREWNYILNYTTADQKVAHCQLKVTFNKDMEVKNLLAHPAGCLDEIDQKQTVAVQQPVAQKFELRSDFLFDFDQHTLKPEGIHRLSAIVQEIKRHDFGQMVIVGHTDRLGSDEYNRTLSEKRAETVAKYFMGYGVPVEKIRAFGAGESYPVKDCTDNQPEANLKACLADNRRVEIEIQ